MLSRSRALLRLTAASASSAALPQRSARGKRPAETSARNLRRRPDTRSLTVRAVRIDASKLVGLSDACVSLEVDVDDEGYLQHFLYAFELYLFVVFLGHDDFLHTEFAAVPHVSVQYVLRVKTV